MRRTFKLLHLFASLAWLWVAFCRFNYVLSVGYYRRFNRGIGGIHFRAETAKERLAAGRTTARRASAGAALRRNMIFVVSIFRCEPDVIFEQLY